MRSTGHRCSASATTSLATLVSFFTLANAGCHLVTPFNPSADADGDADAEVDGRPDAPSEDADHGDGGEADADDADADTDLLSGPGPVVLVTRTIIVVADRRCDIDGDGTLDNSLADAGEASASLIATGLNAAIGVSYTNSQHPVFHFRRVEDRAGPNATGVTVASYGGRDTDLPHDYSDDFLGDEPYYADVTDLDGCGEPANTLEGIDIVDGVFSTGAGTFAASLAGRPVHILMSEMSGTLAPGGASLEAILCGYAPIASFGPHDAIAGLTLLEVALSGGLAFGRADVPGIRPDIDVDSDGLESFDLDGEGRIVRCLDGDRTVIDGRECWRDERLADGFSLAVEVTAVPARYAGREPGWEYQVPTLCASGPVEESFFADVPQGEAACAGLDERCDPRAPRPCCAPDHQCSGANLQAYRCYAPCPSWSESARCGFGPRLASCHESPAFTGALCWPVDDLPPVVGCTVGEACTTLEGVTSETQCVETPDGETCAVHCDEPAPTCGERRRCVPSPFDEGGLCAYMPGYDPDWLRD